MENKKMKKNFNKSLATVVTIVLLLSIAISIASQPISAHTPSWQIPTFAYASIAPNLVGIGQSVTIVVWVDKALPGADVGNDIRMKNYKVIITAPDGTTDTVKWDIVTDTTSSAYTVYTPDQIGNYTVYFEYAGQTYTWTTPINSFGIVTPNTYTNDTYLPSNETTTFLVQETPAIGFSQASLPTEYWSRPIYGENTNWYAISSNWLGSPQIVLDTSPDGVGPNTSHVMWTKLMQEGGLTGGLIGNNLGTTYYTGMSYEGEFASPIILNGRLYYSEPLANSASAGDYVCVDLQTGQEVWRQNYGVKPTFAQVFDYETQNQHGAVSYLFAVSGTTWIAYEPKSGDWVFNITNVPTGTAAYTSKGEIIRYVLNVQNKWLALWNDTGVLALQGRMGASGYDAWRPVGVNADGNTGYSWNTTIPTLPTGASIIGAIQDEVLIIGANWGASMNSAVIGTPSNPQLYAISLDPANRGSLLWSKTYSAPSGNVTRIPQAIDSLNRIVVMYDKETMQWTGYSIDDGTLLWGPVGDESSWNYYTIYADTRAIAYGNIYTAGFGGIVYCYDIATGNLIWTYGNGGVGNSTNSGTETSYGNYPTHIGAIAGGMVYVFTSEHSPNSPLYKGAEVRCLNATTGEEIWTLQGWGESGGFFTANGAIADGYYTFFNAYDGNIYSIGKGPSQTIVTAPSASIELGRSVVLSGTVIDKSEGTKQETQAAHFPNGVPCASDASMSDWMEYIYMQQNKPTNFTGIDVTISVIDANSNYRIIGTTTTDASGFYSLQWTPDIAGKYIVVATFAGNNGYYGSSSESAFAVDPAPATATPQPTAVPSAADLYFLPMSIGIIVAVVVIGAILALLLLRKKP
jgi:outer membrane protein assembly factor BamB